MQLDAKITLAIVSAFLFFATLMAFVTGFALLFPGPLLDEMWKLNPSAHRAFDSLGRAAGILLLLLGLATCATAAGLLKRRKWAWIAALSLFAINGSGDLLTLFWTRDVLRGGSGIVIAGAFLFLLTRPSVRHSLH